MQYHNSVPAFFLVLTTATLSFGSVSTATADTGTAVENTSPTFKNMRAMNVHNANNDIVEILPEDFRPAFTRDTVIKLNTIVHRSYAIIGQFDEFRKTLDNSPNEWPTRENPSSTLNDSRHALLDSLDLRSKMALADMDSAVKELKASGEHYNTAVLAGMIIFVRDVEQEVSRFYQGSLSTRF